MHPTLAASSSNAKPVWCVDDASWKKVEAGLPAAARAFAKAAGFQAEAGRHLLLPDAKGEIAGCLFGLGKTDAKDRDPFLAGKLANVLPGGDWTFARAPENARLAVLAFALGSYRFTKYRPQKGERPRLVVPSGVDGAEITRIAEGVSLARDLVNTPANDLGPAELEAAVRALGKKHRAKVSSIVGTALLKKNFPLVYAVGQGSDRAPRILDLVWGKSSHPKVTLVGKGVCFDTGGLDIKPDSAMLLMKKDMGGAAASLALAHMIMSAKLPVRLRVIIPAVENSISGIAFRPGDIFRSRKGITVEIGNTDAEGRLVLADALAWGDEEKPDLMIDFATLTGAARVALGPEIPPAFTDDDKLWNDLARFAASESDPLWRMPLWRSYMSMLDSKIADTNNVGGGHAGAITAALFLSKFVAQAKSWMHLDIFAWNPKERPGRPEGGEAHSVRALFALLTERYG
ncbi:MAG: leucyl aminopeptidase family protein [Xanthobacteraceae bacterium]|nr:leucyl aminopeptidase family protein [Xanthobacteraceae bacterium]QYK45282.1 MAG: leucyl aminopeptidase family protein [Xanthobacteraceae bacterium]